MKIKGIDVSSHEGVIDWGQVGQENITFAMIRAGWVGWDKIQHLDSRFHYNMTNAINTGIKVGAYVYSYAQTPAHALEEAKFIIEIVKNYNITYPLVIDVEDPRDQAHLTPDQKADIILTFSNAVESAGYTPALYTMRSWLNNDEINMARIEDIDIWLAEWLGSGASPSYINNLIMWQYSSQGRVAGIDGNVDMNYSYIEDEFILLKEGSRGVGVQTLQTNLNALGYNAGVEDGIFGPKTKSALIKFQSANGLVADGIYGPKSHAIMLNKLIEIEEAEDNAVPLEEDQSSVNRILRYGDSGEDVKTVQQLLNKWKIPTTIDGIFGSQTEYSIIEFQRGLGLVDDSIVGKNTLAFLMSPIIDVDQCSAERFRCRCDGKYCNGEIDKVTWSIRMLLIRLCMVGNKSIDEMIIKYGMRCSTYNRLVSGARYSQHVVGRAADVAFSDADSLTVDKWASVVNPRGGIGKRGSTYTHIDSREGRVGGTIWYYN